MSYMHHGGGFEDIMLIDRSPEGADPLWIVRGTAYGVGSGKLNER
jgi:hypothetical protein